MDSSALVGAALAGAHLMLFVSPDEVPRVDGVGLERLPASVLEGAVRPAPYSASARRYVAAAARHSGGLPGRFAHLLWSRGWAGEAGPRRSLAAEAPASYGGPSWPAMPAAPAPVRQWPEGADLAELNAWRARVAVGVGSLERGRVEPGARAVRHATAALARRHDWAHAARGVAALAGHFRRRGRAREALDALRHAQRYAIRSTDRGLLVDVGVLAGHLWIDMGRLDEAERVLRTAFSAARDGDHSVAAATLALLRCLFWRGAFSEGDALLREAASSFGDRTAGLDMRVGLEIAQSRLAVGRGDLAAAVGHAAKARGLVRANAQAGGAGLEARAAHGEAFAHLAVGDAAAVHRDVEAVVSAARLSREPCLALKARLLLAESERRSGDTALARSLLVRLHRLAPRDLPATLRAQAALLAELLDSAPAAADVAVNRQVQQTGFGALALFAPAVGSPVLATASAVEAAVEILRRCQEGEDDRLVLKGICERLRERLGAAAVAFYTHRRGAAVATDGGRIEPAAVERLGPVAQVVAPRLCDGRLEASAPVRYGGDIVGVVLIRWSGGSAPDHTLAMLLLSVAAVAAAPALAGLAAEAERPRDSWPELLGVSAAVVDLRQTVERTAPSPFSVLIEGESGSGKELVARALHRRGPRRDRPFYTLNCAALPDDLVEAELFGHARGAFTGAMAERAGVFEEAHTGTLFLDEIGELSARAQAKVLRALQEGEVRRVGENVARKVDVRIISATNRHVHDEVQAGRFRTDLMYRLDVVRIHVPPLRERREDLPLLVEQAWRDACARIGGRATLASATLAALARYDWPGNVRELQNVLAALAVRAPKRGVVPPTALPPLFLGACESATWRLDDARRSFEERFVRAALSRAGGHRGRAAAELGVTRQGLTKLMVRLRIAESSLNDTG